jgi:hypothetical protein
MCRHKDWESQGKKLLCLGSPGTLSFISAATPLTSQTSCQAKVRGGQRTSGCLAGVRVQSRECVCVCLLACLWEWLHASVSNPERECVCVCLWERRRECMCVGDRACFHDGCEKSVRLLEQLSKKAPSYYRIWPGPSSSASEKLGVRGCEEESYGPASIFSYRVR